MTFQNTVFPSLKLIHGVKKGVIYPTSVVSNGNKEFRINRLAFDRFTWSYPGRAITAESKVALYNFYKAVGGSLDSFLFQDPDFPSFSGQQLVSETGTHWLFNLPGSDHPLYNYDADMVIKRNGSVATWTHSIVNGQPRITIVGSNPADTIIVQSGDCYLAARFDSAVNWSLEAFDTSNNPLVVNLDSVSLMEVFEHA